MGAYACKLRHGMTHQAADAAVPVGKRMDIVEAVMSGGDGHDTSRCLERLKRISLFEIAHEIVDTVARRRDMATDGNVTFGFRTPRARLHHELSVFAADTQHFFGRFAIEFEMKP